MSDVVVIGGTSGIGKATCERLDLFGWNAIALGPNDCDVRVEQMVRDTVVRYRDVSQWVYSAGVNRLAFIEDQEEDETVDIYDVNVFGFLRLVKHLARWRPTDAKTNVVLVGSDAAERPMRTSAVYCGSKAALHMSAKALARELAPRFRINVIAPGMTEPTGMQQYIDQTVPTLRGWTEEEAREYERSQIPMGTRADVEEVAEVIMDVMTGPESMTGSITTINGGR